MEKVFPNRIYQIIILLVISVLVAGPTFFILIKYELSIEIFINIFFFVICLSIILFHWLISKWFNYKIQIDLSLGKVSHLLRLCLLLITFQVGINIPLAGYISTEITSEVKYNVPEVSILFLGILVLAPIFEEYIFRGIILNGLLSRYSPLWSILITNIIFSLLHVQPSLILSAFLIGIFISFVFFRTRNLGICILLHLLANLTSWLFTYVDTNYGISSVFVLLFTLSFIALLKINNSQFKIF